MNLTIRAYNSDDESGVRALWQLAFPDEPAWNESRSLIETKLTVQPELFLVCESGGEVVGTTIAGFDGVRGWVHKVATHPERRKSGIGRMLMEAVEAELAKRGCRKLNLQVRAGNDGAVAFYEELGYGIEDRVSLGKRLG